MQRRDGKLIVSATDLVGFLECGHLTLLDRAMVAGLVAKPDRGEDPGLELLRWRGGMHEERYIEQLRADGREVTDLKDHKELPYAEQAAATEEAMRAGKDVIYQATVFDGRWVGHPDFLLRVEGTPSPQMSRLGRSEAAADRAGIDQTDSNIGKTADLGLWPAAGDRGLGTDWHYEVADTKLAHVAKASALIQIASYVEQIERIQEVRPEHVYVVTGGAEIDVRPFRTADMMAYYRRAKQGLRQCWRRGARPWNPATRTRSSIARSAAGNTRSASPLGDVTTRSTWWPGSRANSATSCARWASVRDGDWQDQRSLGLTRSGSRRASRSRVRTPVF